VCYHIRVARWLITIQEYDIELQHIKGVENHLADILSRNPAGLEVNEIQDLTKPNTISVNKIELKIDQAALKNLKNVAHKQKNDPRIRIISEKAENEPAHNTHRIEEDVLFRRDRLGANLKAMLPECLEAPNHPICAYIAKTIRR
jgi:hypothetical protein